MLDSSKGKLKASRKQFSNLLQHIEHGHVATMNINTEHRDNRSRHTLPWTATTVHGQADLDYVEENKALMENVYNSTSITILIELQY